MNLPQAQGLKTNYALLIPCTAERVVGHLWLSGGGVGWCGGSVRLLNIMLLWAIGRQPRSEAEPAGYATITTHYVNVALGCFFLAQVARRAIGVHTSFCFFRQKV